MKINDLPGFDMAPYIKSDADILAYLSQVLEEGYSGEFAAALGHITKARGMTDIARSFPNMKFETFILGGLLAL